MLEATTKSGILSTKRSPNTGETHVARMFVGVCSAGAGWVSNQDDAWTTVYASLGDETEDRIRTWCWSAWTVCRGIETARMSDRSSLKRSSPERRPIIVREPPREIGDGDKFCQLI